MNYSLNLTSPSKADYFTAEIAESAENEKEKREKRKREQGKGNREEGTGNGGERRTRILRRA